jgi:hypothetical protein
MAAIAFNPGLGSMSSGQVDSAPLPTPRTQLAADTSRVLGGGSLSPLTPNVTAVTDPFSKQELVSRESAIEKSKLTDADANRWAYLERMKVNVGKAHPTDGMQLKSDIDTLQNKLRGYSQDAATYLGQVERLEANGWSKVPFSDHNKELSWARTMLHKAAENIDNTRKEIDKFLDRADSLPYYRHAIDQPRR